MKDAVHAAQTEGWIKIADVSEIILSFGKDSPFVGNKNLGASEQIKAGVKLATLNTSGRRGEVEGASADADIGLEDGSGIACHKIEGQSRDTQGRFLQRQRRSVEGET